MNGIHESLQALSVPIGSLSRLPGNPRRGDVEAVKRSYVTFGQRKPVVASRDGIVIAGNHQLEAASQLGWDALAVVYVDDDDTKARAFALADNRTSELGSYDDRALAEMLQTVASDVDLLEATSFTEADIDALLQSLDVPDIADGGASADVFDAELIAINAAEHYAAAGVPVPRKLPRHESWQLINRLARTANEDLRNSNVGYSVADSYHPHRIQTRVTGKQTALDVLSRPESLLHLMKFLLDNDTLLTDAHVLSALGFIRGGQIASNFRPGFALLTYRRFCRSSGVVLDTSTGYGGRLVGFLASECSRYIGIDPNTQTHAGNLALAADMLAADRVELINAAAEDVAADPNGLVNSCDFAFTSPPYFSKEQYSDDDTQSWVRYKSGTAWRDSFLVPMLRLQYAALKHDTYSVVNIADVRLGKDVFPLVQWTIDAALQAGFVHERTERFPLSRVPGQGEKSQAFEPVLVFRKLSD